MTSLLCCFRSPSPPQPPVSNNDNNIAITNNSDNDAHFSYFPPPPPRYTPRPASIHEKTIEAHLPSEPGVGTSEKHHHDSSERVSPDSASDISSALSFPSSYGNTSTATGDTPPPPYSPRLESPGPASWCRRPSVSSDLSAGAGACAGVTVPPLAHVAPPRAGARTSDGYFRGFDDER